MITGKNIDLQAMRIKANLFNKTNISRVKVNDNIFVYWFKGNTATISVKGVAIHTYNMNNFDNYGKLRNRLNEELLK